MKFILSMPPSINQTYGVNRTGMHALYKRSEARVWENVAGWELKQQWKKNKQPFTGDVKVAIKWFYQVNRDIDAGIKILFDLLQKQRVVLNDRQIRKISSITIEQDTFNPRVEIIIDEMDYS